MRTARLWVYSMGMTQTSTATQTFFTGRDILAAENHLRQGTEAQAMRIVVTMPTEVVARLAAHVKADPTDLTAVVQRARLPYAAR